MSETQETAQCPACGGEPRDVSWVMAPDQHICGTEDCEVVSWIEGGGAVGD